MKKILALFLAALLVVSLAACSSTQGEIKKPTGVSGGNTDQNGPGQQDDGADTPDTPDDGENAPGTNDAPQNQDVSITETVLVDEAGVKITAKITVTK